MQKIFDSEPFKGSDISIFMQWKIIFDLKPLHWKGMQAILPQGQGLKYLIPFQMSPFPTYSQNVDAPWYKLTVCSNSEIIEYKWRKA